MNSLVRCSIGALLVVSLASWPIAGSAAPGDVNVETDTSVADSTMSAGRLCENADATERFYSEHKATFDFVNQYGFVAALYSVTLGAIDYAELASVFDCIANIFFSLGPIGSKAPAAQGDVYAVGSAVGGDAGMVIYHPASDTSTSVPIHLSDSGSDRLLGIAYLGGETFAVAGEVNSIARVGIVDLSVAMPTVSGGFTIDQGAPDNVFFDLARNRDGSAAYATGRAGIYLVICKVALPGATQISAFNGGCEGTSFGTQLAEGHEAVALNNGDVAIVGTLYVSAVPHMFIAVVDGTTGAPDNAFDTDGLWVEGISGSTQSEGWGIVALNFGIAAVGWADISGQRELIMPVFDGLQPDTRYPNNGIVRKAIGTEGHALSVANMVPPSPAVLQPAATSPDFDLVVLGDENSGAQGFDIGFEGVWPDSLFGDGFDKGGAAGLSADSTIRIHPIASP